uniref:Tripartite motif containing 101 n=1 Tax=Neogobius melanostomus TaxID=47308 RepID=A0A8C6ULH6_9GOBI
MSLSADLSCLKSGEGAEREAALASLEKQLICPICLEIFNKPVVILPCQHNLCRKCANELYQVRHNMLVNSGRFRCPSCRHEVVLDRHGVYGLQRNLLVENIIDVYKQELAQATCVDHEGEKVNIYCLSCRVPTCSLCKVFGAHQSCRVAPLADVYQQQKDELKEGLSALAEHGTRIQEMIDELNQMCSDLEEAYKGQKQTVSDKFDHIKSILEEKRKVNEINFLNEAKPKCLYPVFPGYSLLRCYGDTLTTNTKLLERAQSSVEEPDPVAFVQVLHPTLLVAANASCPTETLDPDDENLSHYKYNFSPQYRALLSLQFPRGNHWSTFMSVAVEISSRSDFLH